MMSFSKRWVWALSLGCAAAQVGCLTGDPGEPTGQQRSAIYGAYSFADTSCTATQQAFFRDAGFVARTVVSSPAWEACVRARIPANYRRCTSNGSDGDPNVALTQHVANALAASRSVNNVVMTCNPSDPVWGRASVGTTPGYYGDERFSFGNTAIIQSSMIGRPACAEGQSFATHGCRDMPYPAGLREVAATVIHENMHQHGYTHMPSCNDATIVDTINSMPWIVDQCVENVVDASMAACGDICQGRVGDDLTACRARGRLRLVTALGATTCHDVHDPGVAGLGALQMRSNELVALDMLPHQRPFGPSYGSLNRADDRLLARGDLDPWQPGEEMLFEYSSSGLRAGWNVVGWDVRGAASERTTFAATRAYSSYLDLLGAPTGTARWLLLADTAVVAVGRFSSAAQWGADPAREEILVRSPDGLGLLAVSGNLRTRNRMPVGAVLTGASGVTWTVGATDPVLGVADVDGNGQSDVIVRNSARIAILSRTGADGSFRVLDARDIAGSAGFYGAWDIGTGDVVLATGDFVGDAREELLVRSAWGYGLLGMPSGATTLRDLWRAAHGTSVESRWTLRAVDAVHAAGRFHSGTKKSVIVTSSNGLANLAWTTSGAAVVATVPHLTPASGGAFLDPDVAGGFWAYGTTNTLHSVGDFDGDGRDSVVIRSGWGWGIIGPSSTRATWFLHDANATGCGNTRDVACNNGMYGNWLARETDAFVTSLKDSAGVSSLVVRSRI